MFRLNVEKYGYRFSISRFVISSLVIVTILILAGCAYMLHFMDLLIISISGVLSIPFIIKYDYKNRYESRRFIEITQYMELLCASFNKNVKILAALKDVEIISQGRLKKLVKYAIEHIESGRSYLENSSIYEEALEPIEKEFGCKRLYQLHDFLIKVENEGGEFKLSLNSILKDIHSWVERTMIFQKEKATVRIMFIVGTIISLLICTISIFLGKYVDISENPMYRIITVMFLMLCIFSIVVLEKSLSGSWLDHPLSEEYIVEEFNTATNYSPGKIRKRMLPLYIVVVVLSAIMFFIGMKVISVALIMILLIIFLIPNFRYKSAFDRTVLEIKYSFSEWIRIVAVNLQYQTVRMSIQDSYEDAPVILKEPIKKLLKDIDEHPGNPQGYLNFLDKFNVHEVESAMKMLYSLTELGADESSQTLEALINRNHALIDKIERENADNKMTFLKQIITVPMIFAGLKIVVDMLLFITGFISQMGNVGQLIS